MAMDNVGLADIAAVTRDQDGFGGSGWWVIILFFAIMMNGGWGGNNFANAIGYENLATSNEIQRGFDNQNQLANEREILGAINQNFHDTLTAGQGFYNELQRDLGNLALGQQTLMSNQAQCCCETKMLIQQNAADNALAMSQMEARLTQKMDQNEITALRDRLGRVELDQALQGVVRYPNGFVYNAGYNPFCTCHCTGTTGAGS